MRILKYGEVTQSTLQTLKFVLYYKFKFENINTFHCLASLDGTESFLFCFSFNIYAPNRIKTKCKYSKASLLSYPYKC